jgi:mannose-6-phosphate isomerase-like protein (cupin superfamily)
MTLLFWEKTKEKRPWGGFEILSSFPLASNNNKENITIKKITVNPGKRLSYQAHQKRSEHWFIIKGTAQITLNDTEHDIKIGESFNIPIRAKHRIKNASQAEPLIFIEISTGDFSEADVTRYEDDYGRV